MEACVSDYMTAGFGKNRKSILDKAVRKLKLVMRSHPFTAIAFRGVSGALFAPSIADKLKVGLIAIRKETENCHSSCLIEGLTNVNYIIVDDFISSGRTIREIVGKIQEEDSHNSCKCVGYYMWHPQFEYDTRMSEYTDGVICLNELK